MLRMEDVSFQVSEGNGTSGIEIIKDLNIEFEKGKVYAITGPNGGGKTSVAKLIMGIYKPTRGKIYLDDEEISQVELSARARLGLAYAFQHPPRFKGLSIQDIMQIAAPELDMLHIRSTLRDVGLCPEEYLERDLGSNLSGGEVKRVEIAQLLARNAPISIFDEPEAGVDLWTIQKLIGIIMSRYKGVADNTAIIITHNENILPICDEIIVVDEGMIKMQGSNEEIWPLIEDEIKCQVREKCMGDVAYENQ